MSAYQNPNPQAHTSPPKVVEAAQRLGEEAAQQGGCRTTAAEAARCRVVALKAVHWEGGVYAGRSGAGPSLVCLGCSECLSCWAPPAARNLDCQFSALAGWLYSRVSHTAITCPSTNLCTTACRPQQGGPR